MAEYHNQEAASDAFGVNVETLKEWKSEPWFPKDGWMVGKGYDIEKIRDAKDAVLPADNGGPIHPIDRTKFTPTCPKGKDHRARVFKTVGRTRECVCDTCGHQFPQVGEYSNVALETLRRIAVMLEDAIRSEIPDGKGGAVSVVFFETKTVVQAAKYCRAAIKAKQ